MCWFLAAPEEHRHQRFPVEAEKKIVSLLIFFGPIYKATNDLVQYASVENTLS